MSETTGTATERDGRQAAGAATPAPARVWQKLAFRLRFTVPLLRPALLWNTFRLRLLGAAVGAGTLIPPDTQANWPHQLRFGTACHLEDGIAFKFADSWKPGPSIVFGDRVYLGRHAEFNITDRLEVGDDALIAAGCRFVDHDHGIALGVPMNQQDGPKAAIRVGRDVWIGANAVILKGVTIGDGAIVGAGAVVTKSVPANEIWAGVPARKIGERA
jgi:acetyltransferase-like isoleucine patch superfamily enzyme